MAVKLCEGGIGGDTKLIFAKESSFLLKIKKKKFTNISASAKKKMKNTGWCNGFVNYQQTFLKLFLYCYFWFVEPMVEHEVANFQYQKII